MGNKNSTASSTNSQELSKFKERINIIAAKFILGRKFKELKLLVSESYCNELMILTKDVLASNFTTEEIRYLATDSSSQTKEPVMYISKRDFENVERASSNKKLLMCKGIAKFYVRVAHLFAAIATTVSPNWASDALSSSSSSSSAPSGLQMPSQPQPQPQPPQPAQQQQQQQQQRGGQLAASGDKLDFCSVRIRALLGATSSQADGKTMLVQPTVCSIYASTNENSLLSQPGLPELGYLYDDIYDSQTGKFSGRSIAMQSLYDSDLRKLYFAFTGNSDMPEHIKTFGDINILSLARYKECGPVVPTAKQAPPPVNRDDDPNRYRMAYGYYGDVERERREKLERDKDRVIQEAAVNEKYYKSERENYSGKFKTQFTVAKNSSAYINYGTHINQMVNNADRARANLMKIIDKLFMVVETASTSEPGRKKAIITLHPNLTYVALDALINQAREMIINLYVGCERDFYTGLGLLHVIIEEIMNANMTAQLDRLKIGTRKAIEKLGQDAVRANARNGIVRPKYDVSDPALLSSSQLNNFVKSEKAAVEARVIQNTNQNAYTALGKDGLNPADPVVVGANLESNDAADPASAPAPPNPAPLVAATADPAAALPNPAAASSAAVAAAPPPNNPDASSAAADPASAPAAEYGPDKIPERSALKRVGFAPQLQA